MSDLIDRQALLKQIDIDSDGEPGYYGDTWKFIDTIKNMPNVHDLPKDTDTISRQAAIEALLGYLVGKRCPDDGTLTCRLIENEVINKLPSAQPEPYTDALKAEIKRMKRSFTICINSDYYTGYMSALSAVEGYIAQMEVTT